MKRVQSEAARYLNSLTMWYARLFNDRLSPLGLTPGRIIVVCLVMVNVALKVESRRHAGTMRTAIAATSAGAMRSALDAPPTAANAQTAAPLKRVIVTKHHNGRRKPLVRTGRELPFTCSAGDVFHMSEAPPGWDTFTCLSRNVWSLTTTQLIEYR
jgi:hypothetical protein